MIVLLLVIAAVVGFLWAGWVMMQSVAKLPGRSRLWFAILLSVLILAELIQHISGYSLASPWAPLVILILATIAYFLAMFLAWHWNRLVAAAGLALPVIFLIFEGREAVMVAALILGTQQIAPVAEGRITPSVSYRIVLRHSLWGGTPFYAYEIYRNPRWLPLVEKPVTSGPEPCGTGAGPGMVSIRAGREPGMVEIGCANAPEGAPPILVPVR